MFNTPAQAQQMVSDTLQQLGVSSLPAWYASIIAKAQDGAYDQITAALTARGYTLAQVTAWDMGSNFEYDLTVFAALAQGGILEKVDTRLLEKFEHKGELEKVILTIGGVAVYPAGGPMGLANAGPIGTGAADSLMAAGWCGPPGDYPCCSE